MSEMKTAMALDFHDNVTMKIGGYHIENNKWVYTESVIHLAAYPLPVEQSADTSWQAMAREVLGGV